MSQHFTVDKREHEKAIDGNTGMRYAQCIYLEDERGADITRGPVRIISPTEGFNDYAVLLLNSQISDVIETSIQEQRNLTESIAAIEEQGPITRGSRHQLAERLEQYHRFYEAQVRANLFIETAFVGAGLLLPRDISTQNQKQTNVKPDLNDQTLSNPSGPDNDVQRQAEDVVEKPRVTTGPSVGELNMGPAPLVPSSRHFADRAIRPPTNSPLPLLQAPSSRGASSRAVNRDPRLFKVVPVEVLGNASSGDCVLPSKRHRWPSPDSAQTSNKEELPDPATGLSDNGSWVKGDDMLGTLSETDQSPRKEVSRLQLQRDEEPHDMHNGTAPSYLGSISHADVDSKRPRRRPPPAAEAARRDYKDAKRQLLEAREDFADREDAREASLMNYNKNLAHRKTANDEFISREKFDLIWVKHISRLTRNLIEAEEAFDLAKAAAIAHNWHITDKLVSSGIGDFSDKGYAESFEAFMVDEAPTETIEPWRHAIPAYANPEVRVETPELDAWEGKEPDFGETDSYFADAKRRAKIQRWWKKWRNAP